MICNRCGNKNLDNAKFCSKCGAPLDSLAGNKSGAAAVKKQKSKKPAVIVVSAVLIIIVAAACVFAFLPKIERSVLGEGQYYLMQEYKNIKDILNADNLAELRHPESYSADCKATINFDTFSFDDDFINSFSANSKVNYDKKIKQWV